MCFRNCAKYFFAIINVVLFLVGVAFFVAGIILLTESGIMDPSVLALLVQIGYSDTVRYGIVLMNVGYLLIATGGIIMVVAVLGLISAFTKFKPCIAIFIIVIVLVILMQATMVGLVISLNGRSDSWLQGQMLTLLDDYKGPQETDAISAGFNKLFIKARCCGVDTYSDFLTSTWYSAPSGKVLPETCCQGVDTDEEIAALVASATAACPRTPTDYYTQGCYSVIRTQVFTHLLIICTVSAGGLIIEITALVLAGLVMNQSKNRIKHMNVMGASPRSASHALPPPYIGLEALVSSKGKL